MDVRPTPDRMRETLFNILGTRVEDSIFLDAYAGTGAVGIEALSRGAKSAILIERRADALAVLRGNLRTLGIGDEARVLRGTALDLLPDLRCDIAFIDPPYEMTKEYRDSLPGLDASGCQLAIAQHLSKLTLEDVYGPFRKTRIVKQGDNSLSFFERA
ncbi:MAG: putative methyltransferase [Bryobacterales bacterium]|jgi:16S rRNA (guanine966-N2)-methyltransferase|nr:putative methyltransferase [Bryobacterales bacterium]